MRLNKIFYVLKKYTNSLYYLNSSFSKNSYPCKLIGEKLSSINDEPNIIFKILGKTEKYSIPISKILFNKIIISSFSPKDSLKLGQIAFNFMINNQKADDKLITFSSIKEMMLTSIHDIFSNVHLFGKAMSSNFGNPRDIEIEACLKSLTANNKYPFKLVGYKSLSKTEIIYTIFGKREGYQKSLSYIIKTESMLSKFHPTEAVKFGFISAGEEFLIINKES